MKKQEIIDEINESHIVPAPERGTKKELFDLLKLVREDAKLRRQIWETRRKIEKDFLR